MSEDLKIKIIGSLNETKTTKEIKDQLKAIESKLNVSIGVDKNQLKGLTDDIKRLQNEFKKTTQGNTFFDDNALKQSKQYSGQIDDIIKQIKAADKEISSVSSNTIFDTKTGDVKGFNLELNKTSGIVEKLKFQLKRLETEKGVFNDQFVLSDKSQSDKTQVEMQKALSKTLESRQKEEKRLTEEQAKAINKNIDLEKKQSAEIKKQNDELAHRLEMYKQQAALNVKKLQRNYDSSDLDTRAMQGYLSQVNHLTTATPDLKKKMDNLDMSFKNIRESVSAAGSHTLSFSDQLAIAAERTVIWTAATTALFGSIRLLNMWIDQVVLLDDKLTSIKKVADGDIDMSNVLQSNIDAAEEFGRKLDGALDSYEKIIALGYSAQDAMKLNENSMLMATVGENLSDQQSAEYLTAIMKQYEMSVEQTSKIVDSFNNLSNKTGATVESLSSSLSKSSAAAKVAGIGFDELAGISASLQETLHITGQESGNFLKTLSTRLIRSDNLKMLESLNVQVRDSNGELLAGTKILENLSNVYGSFNKTTQNDISQALGGVYHINKVNTVLTKMDDILKYTTYSMDSFNSAQNELSTFQEGLTYKINNLILSFQKLAMEASTAGGRDGLVTIIESAEKLVTGFSNLIDATDGWVISLSPALGTLTGLFLALNGTTRKSIMEQGLLSASLVRTGDSMSIATGKSRLLQQQMYNMTLATRAATGAMSTLGKIGKSSIAFLGSAFLPIAGMMLLGEGISILMEKYQDAKKAEEDLRKEQESTVKSYGQQREKVDSLVEAHLKYASIKNKTKEEEKEHLDIQQQLSTMMPSLVSEVDSYGNAHIKVGKALKEELDYAKELVELQKQNITETYTKKFDKSLDKRKDALKQIKKLQDDLDNPEGYYSQKEGYSVGKMSDKDIAKAQLKLRAFQRDVANTNLLIRDQVNEMITEILKLNNVEINDTLSTQIKEAVEAMDVKNLNADEIATTAQDLSNALADYQKKLNDGSSGQAIQQNINDMKVLAKTFGFTDKEANAFIDTLIKQSGAHKEATESAEEQAEANEKLLKSYDDAVSNIESLNGIINDLNEGKGISSDSISLMIEKYPDLLAYLDDEATLREKISEEVTKEENIALDVMTEKLKNNEQYFAKVKDGNSALIKTLSKGYNVDLQNVKSLAQFKLAIEQGLIKKLGSDWATYYDIQTRTFTEVGRKMMETMSYREAINSPQLKAIAEYEASMKSLTAELRGITSSSGLGNIASSGLKSYEQSVYVSDKFKQALEKVNAELEKQNKIQAKFPKHSKEYQNSIKLEINLLKQKKKLLEDQAKALEAQIKAGKIQQTGVVSSASYSVSSSSYASGNSSSAQIWNFFKSKGFSDSIAAGIMGNLKLESGLNPNALNGSSGAFGIAQWLGGRKTALKNYANAVGTSINDLNTQLEFLWKELNSTEKRTLNYLNGNQGASAATIAAAFDRLFERSEGTHIPQRQKYANQFYSQYSGSAGAYVASTTTGSQEAAKAMESVDQAKSELIQLKLDALEIDGLISQLQVDLVNAEFAKNERTIRQIESHLKIYEDNFEEAVKGQWMYEVSLQNQINLLNNKRKILQEEQKYISTQIRTNKGLTQAQKAELEMRNLDIRDSLIELNNSIKELSWEKTIHSLVKFTSEVEKMDYKLRLSKQNQALFNKESEGYASELNSQRGFILDKIVAMEKEKIAIDQIRASQNLDQQQKKELNDRYLELKVSILEAQDALQELQNEASQAKLDNVLSQIDKVVDGISRKLKEIDNRIHVTDPEDEKAMIALYNERLDALLEQRKAALANIESLEAISKELAGNDEALKQNADEIQKWKDSLSDVDISIFDQKQAIEDYYEDIANSYVEAMKEAYEAEKKVKLDNLNKMREAEEKAHNDRMKEMDEESKAIDEQYNKQLRALNDQESADDYAKELSKKQSSAQELQAKINALSMDDSEWAKKEKERLEKELAEMQEEIEEYKNDRALELRRQSLEDEKNAKQDQLNSEREAENKAWEERQKALDEQRQQIEQYYENLLENEREWAKMREDIMNGNVDYYKTKLEEMAKFVSDNGKIIGDSIAQNISDALNKAKENIGSITESIKDLFATVDKESKQQDSNAEQTANNRKKTEEEPPTTGKLVINKPIKLWTRKNGKLEYVRGLNPGESYKVYDYDEKYGGQFNVGNNHWVTDMDGYVKFQKYHDGGIVGGKGSRLTELANKLFNEKPNEQTVTALKRELFAPEKNMPNFFNNIKNFSSSLVKPTGTPSVVYNLDLTIGSVTGNKDGGKVVFGEVVKGLKKMGKL